MFLADSQWTDRSPADVEVPEWWGGRSKSTLYINTVFPHTAFYSHTLPPLYTACLHYTGRKECRGTLFPARL